jgi:lipocalin
MKFQVGMVIGKKILQDDLTADRKQTIGAECSEEENNYQTPKPVAGHKPAKPVKVAHKAAAHILFPGLRLVNAYKILKIRQERLYTVHQCAPTGQYKDILIRAVQLNRKP